MAKKTDRHVSNDGKTRPLKNYLRILGSISNSILLFSAPPQRVGNFSYIISGTGKAFCDGVEELLMPGVMHICPQCSEHSIINTGEEDLVMLTIVVKK